MVLLLIVPYEVGTYDNNVGITISMVTVVEVEMKLNKLAKE